jgi:hydrogenase nickel incorporation protein HypB
LFIENVGPRVPFLLRSRRRFAFRAALGNRREDKPLKYPTIFNSADVAIITKSDLADAVEFDEAAARRNIQSVRPGMEVFKISAKTGEGIAEYMNCLDKRRSRSRAAAAAAV